MKRKVAKRKLNRTCCQCGKGFCKGEVYYVKRTVFEDWGEILASEYTLCPRCKYKNQRRHERWCDFVDKGKCHHPIVEEVWRTMDGEPHLMEPSHDECKICGANMTRLRIKGLLK